MLLQAEKVVAIRKQESNANRSKWLNIKIFTNYKEMLASTSPDCVFIGLPPGAHGCDAKPIELECIAARAHVFIEKP